MINLHYKLFINTYAPFLALLCLLLISCFRDFYLLFQTNLPVGIDGYFYVLQVNSIRQNGFPLFPTTTPIVVYFLSAVSFLTPNIETAIKIGAIFLHLLLGCSVFAVIKNLTKDFRFGLIAFMFTAFSGLHLYQIGEYLNNLGALAFLMWSIFGAIRFWETRKVSWLIFTALFFLPAFFSHRSILAFVVLIAVCYAVAWLLLNEKFNRKTGIFAFILTLFIFAFPLIAAWQSFIALPDWLENEVLKSPRLPFRFITLAESLMLLIALSGTSVFYFRRKLEHNLPNFVLLTVLLWSFWLTLNPFLNRQTGFFGIIGRLDSLAYLQAAIAVPLFLALAAKHSKVLFAVSTLIFAGLLISSFLAPLPVGLREDYWRKRENLAENLPSIKDRLCAKPFIIAPHGDQFLITAILDIPAQQKPPLENKFECVYRLLTQPAPEIEFPESIQIPNGKRIFVKEEAFQERLKQMSREELKSLRAVNPFFGKVIK